MAESIVASTAAAAAAVTSTTPASSEIDRQKLNNDLDDFLTLLVAQLQNQDPTDPLDASQFTEQIVQLSSVEQAIATNANLEQLISLQQNGFDAGIVGWTGQLVEVNGSRAELSDDGLTFAYELDGDVRQLDNVFVQVFDDSGKLIFAGEGTRNSGRNTVSWDGLDIDGNQASLGLYNVVASTRDNDGKLETIDTFVGGRVDGVNLAADEPTLVVNGVEISLEDVNFIGNPG